MVGIKVDTAVSNMCIMDLVETVKVQRNNMLDVNILVGECAGVSFVAAARMKVVLGDCQDVECKQRAAKIGMGLQKRDWRAEVVEGLRMVIACAMQSGHFICWSIAYARYTSAP